MRTLLFLSCFCFNLVTPQISQSNSTTQQQPSGSIVSNSSRLANSSLSQVTRLNQTISNQTTINNNSTTNATAPASPRLSSLLTNEEAVPLDIKITVPFSILGVLLIISGAPMAFWGGRNRWSSYFLTGAYVAALLVMIPILRFGVIEQDHHPSTAIQGVFVLACLISAIAGGALAVIFWQGTRFLVGAAGGFVISVFVLSLKTNSLIPAVGLRWVVILIGITVGFILATIPALSIHVTLFATAALGAAAVVLGIDCFTTGGLKEFWLYIVGFGAMFPKLANFPFTVTMQAELGVMGGLFLMGAAIQWRLLEIIRKKINELKQLDAERRLEEDAAAYRQSMALDADLAMWEKRHGGDDGDSVTMTLAATPSKPYHSRKSSQFSLLPLASASPRPSHAKFEDSPRVSDDHLPSIDSGLGLAGSLGIVEEDSHLVGPPEQAKLETSHPTGVPLPRQFPTHSPPHPATPSMSINFEQSDNDRRFSRPPGAPSSWTTASKLHSKNPIPLAASNSRLVPPSPKPLQSRPLSHYPLPGQQEDGLARHARSRTTSEQPFRATAEHTPYPSSQRPEETGRTAEPKPRADPKRHSEQPSRVIVGAYQAPGARSSRAQKRESSIMTVEELDQRHRQAMKKMQLPATEKISSPPEFRQPLELPVRTQLPNTRSSVLYPAHHNNAQRPPSHLPSSRNAHQHHHHDQITSSPPIHQTNLGSSSPKPQTTQIPKLKPPNGWLDY